jgi:phage baseplate assembly protein gpV
VEWQLGSCTYSEYDVDGFLGIQVDGFGEDESGVPPYETWHPFGFVGRPLDPDSDGSCAVLIFFDGDEGFTVAMSDSRAAALIPPVKKGGSSQYATPKALTTRSFDVHDGDDGTKQIYIEYFDGGTLKAHVVTIGLDANGKAFCEFLHGDGMGLTCIEKVAMLRNAPGSVYVSVDDDGATINGNTKINGSLSVVGDMSADGEVIARAAVAPVKLGTHLTPSPFGPIGPPTPFT